MSKTSNLNTAQMLKELFAPWVQALNLELVSTTSYAMV
jgi:hypothetical protein